MLAQGFRGIQDDNNTAMGLETLSASSASAMNRLQSNVVKAITGYYRLKDFIHALRACKTQAAERALVAKESFAIRTAFKEDTSQDHRYHSIAKLLYIHLLGYPAHFGQVECLKLAASPRLTDKRLGYLGVVLLFDEQQQTLTLVTNSLKSDLASVQTPVVGLALSALAAIGSVEIAYELADEVVKLLEPSRNPNLRKKAGFCACRLIEKVPDLAELFEDKISTLINDRVHSVALGGVSLALELVKINPTVSLPMFRRTLIPSLVRLLQGLIGGSGGYYSSDYDVGGINDPFLQVQVLKLLRALGRADQEASDSMLDILTQLAASLDGSRNVGQAVLYETLLTILSIKSDDSLRSMAVGILARLLSNHTDHNLRYVSLNLLSKVIHDPAAGQVAAETVQKHREIVLTCLSDPDNSIRRRAVDVSLALINKSTIRETVAQLQTSILDGSNDADLELTSLLITKISILAARFAPNGRWYVDTLKYLLDAMRAPLVVPAKEEIVSTFVRIVNNTEDIQLYATKTLYYDMPTKPSDAIIQATAWCLGEYGHLLLSDITSVSEKEKIIASLISWSNQPGLSSSTLAYIITALGKLSHRFESATCLLSIQRGLQEIAQNRRSDEASQKALETLALLTNAALRSIVFAPIPADKKFAIGSVPNLPPSMSNLPVASGSSSALDRSDSPAPAVDVFAELAMLSLDGLPSGASSAKSAGNNNQTRSSFSNFASPLSPPSPAISHGRSIFDSNGLQIFLRLIPDVPGNGQHVLLTAKNRLSSPITGVQILCAVPKSLRVALDPATGSSLPPSGTISQLVRISYASDEPTACDLPKIDPAKVKLRVRVSFSPPLSSQSITETIEIGSLL